MRRTHAVVAWVFARGAEWPVLVLKPVVPPQTLHFWLC